MKTSSMCSNSSLDSIYVSSDDDDDVGHSIDSSKKNSGVALPPGFLDPLPTMAVPPPPPPVKSCRQFWKAGDYEFVANSSSSDGDKGGGLDHVRVHPMFLHSNATSHKWALGAFAELLDNSVDEISHGATQVSIDVVPNERDGGSKMLVIEDDGGGMNFDTMRHCMSFGYSSKGKLPNTIGRYGNGFKTSTMRLGADVIVFSRCAASQSQSIGLLSYTFLTSTSMDDIVVPFLDYNKNNNTNTWTKRIRSSLSDWNQNLQTILQWSPYSTESQLHHQFDLMKQQNHGTRVVIYNLWEDDQGDLELDFDTDLQDIQIRGVNRDQTKIEMAKNFPNSTHFLTYQHSLRSYSSMLYFHLPPDFKILLRGKPVKHHNIVQDMMLVKNTVYRPAGLDTYADVTLGFVKDAKNHLDVQGFNVYHKNRLIQPFWRVWNAAGSDGRGVIGVLQVDFIEPAHDKQGFENTPVLQRLKQRLLHIQKEYWSSKCHEIGYAPRGIKRKQAESPEPEPEPAKKPLTKQTNHELTKERKREFKKQDANLVKPSFHLREEEEDQQAEESSQTKREGSTNTSNSDPAPTIIEENSHPTTIIKENKRLKERLKEMEDSYSLNLQLERERCSSLEAKLKDTEQKLESMDKEAETLIEIFSEERNRRDNEETRLRDKLKESAHLIEELQNRLTALENRSEPSV